MDRNSESEIFRQGALTLAVLETVRRGHSIAKKNRYLMVAIPSPNS